MTLTTAYLTSTKNLEGILNAIQTAQAPEKFTTRFLESLEYKTAADRLAIGVLKGLKFLDDNSIPTERYYKFLDQTEGGRVLAEGIREAYDDLFRINIKANNLSLSDVKNKLKTLTQGQKTDTVLDDMAQTFVALCALADWKIPPSAPTQEVVETESQNNESSQSVVSQIQSLPIGQLCYNIQIILPATRDTAVYDALFKSLKEHLLK
ncbi:MAG: DUF5343 domain-containing protein [Chloroflexi bacterium]|nr:DUF5343 domain-containing protein [Chloroflexota bacterium]